MPVALSCTGLPIETTCGFTQATVPAGGGTVTLYLTPAAPHACGSEHALLHRRVRCQSLCMAGRDGCVAALLLRPAPVAAAVLRGVTLVLAFCVLPVLNGCGTGCTDYGTEARYVQLHRRRHARPPAPPPAYDRHPVADHDVFNATL